MVNTLIPHILQMQFIWSHLLSMLQFGIKKLAHTHIHMSMCTQSNIKRVWIHNNQVKTEGGRNQNFQMAVRVPGFTQCRLQMCNTACLCSAEYVLIL